MKSEYFISITLDTRRPKTNGKYPVKLRLFTSHPRKQKLYSTKFEFTKKEFQSTWEVDKPRLEHKEARNEMKALELMAEEVAKAIKPFSISQFEKKFLRNKGDGIDAIYHYKVMISKLEANENINTAETYDLALKSFTNFITKTSKKIPTKISLTDITPDWLQRYENYMVKDLERSKTTVSIYVRTLRAIFNVAIKDKEIDTELYPFGKGKYQPPAVKNVKKALSKFELKTLFEAKPNTDEQYKAKDFWFFSYACNGMNIKDIALLKYGDIEDNKLVFYRAKTANTSKTDLKPVTAYLTPHAKGVIEAYGNDKKDKKEYIFSIISKTDTAKEKQTKIKNFTKFINQNLKILAKSVGITEDISTYWARHSFATNAIRKGASMEFMSEALNHSNTNTTKGYFAGFEDKDKKLFMEQLMDFD
ncbi:MAG: site-specific integrase [Bacteroidota bacterium]